LYEGWDDQYQCPILDEDRVRGSRYRVHDTFTVNRLGITTSLGIISHLVVNRPYRVPYLPTKWWSFSVKSALDKNNEGAFARVSGGLL
jgi:hypothetical protein